MSVIIEALKKAQKIRMGKKARTVTTHVPWTPAWQKKKLLSNKYILIFGAASLMSMGAVYSFIRAPFRPTVVAGVPAIRNSSPAVQPPLVLKEISADSVAPASFSLKEVPAQPPPSPAGPSPAAPAPVAVPEKPRPEVKAAAKEMRPSKTAMPKVQPAPKPPGDDQKVALAKVEPPDSEVRPAAPKLSVDSPRPEKAAEKELKIQTDAAAEAVHHFNMGVYYQKTRKFSEATEEYKKTLRLDPLNAEAQNNLGIIYKDLSRWEEAIQQYQKALSINPKYDKARHNLATAYYLQGELDRAIIEFHLAIDANPRNPESYNNLGLLYRKQKKIFEAKEVFRKGLLLNPGYSPLHYNLALTLEEEGDPRGAALHYRKFVELTPDGKKELIARVKKHLESLSDDAK